MRDTGCGISRLILCTAAIVLLITLRPVPAPIYHIGTPSVQTISNNIQLFSSPSTKLTKPETAILSSVSVWSGAVSQGVASGARLKATPATTRTDAEVQVAGALLSMVDT